MNPLRVLLVDDEPDQILLARAYLSTADPAVSVESSASAPEALKQLENQSFDRIVSDYLMTDMNGLELCVTLRERGGMGLGLYFVRMAVEAHGGGVGFASRPGEGTTFKVTLP